MAGYRSVRTDAASLEDEELVASALQGDDRALVELLARYRPLVRQIAKGYFVRGGDRDDVVQEGYIGLYRAVCHFDAGAGARFRTFASVCVTNQIRSAVVAATRRKHGPLNACVSLSRFVPSDEEPAFVAHDDPADTLILLDEHADVARFLRAALTPLERDVLARYLDGCSYDVIAERLDRPRKTVDNALQRIRRKVAEHYLPAAA